MQQPCIILQFRTLEDREPLLSFREDPPPEFMDVHPAFVRYDYVTAAQERVRTSVREAPAHAVQQ